ncbi:MAG: family 14 glycosylhydrolase [bacterium]
MKPGKSWKNNIIIATVVTTSLLILTTMSHELPAREVTLGATNFEPGTDPAAIRAAFAARGVERWAQAGVSSWESYVRWSGIETAPGVWDFSMYDEEAAILREYGLMWVPFLIAGPSYTTPAWFKSSDKSAYFKCLEHGKESGVQSLFNPHLRGVVEEFIRRFAARYRDSGTIESVLLGISGDYGEAIYPVMDVGHWTGDYHQHPGYWAGDAHARASFTAWLENKYGTVGKLNAAWGADFARIDEPAPFPPERAHSRAAWLDMIAWYRESMEEWADFWLETARKHFPGTPLYLCTGGDGEPRHGSRFGRQAKLAARHRAGIRITNEGSDYAANFTLTRWVASACRFYGCYFGFEPAGPVTETGVARRVYNVTASGARQLFEYDANVLGPEGWKGDFPRWLRMFAPLEPVVRAAVFIPETHLALNTGRWAGFYSTLRALRDIADYDFVDEGMAADGALDGYQVVYVPEGEVIEDAAADALERWVMGGGLLAGAALRKVRRVSGVPLLPECEPLLKKNGDIEELARPCGAGFVVSHPPELTQLASLMRTGKLHEQIFLEPCRVSAKYVCPPRADSASDRVFTTLTTRGLLMLNASDNACERELKLDAESLKALGAAPPADGTLAVRLEPREMKLFEFCSPPRRVSRPPA